MLEPLDARAVRGKAAGDQYARQHDSFGATDEPAAGHELDSEASLEVLRQCLNWYYLERELQSANRLDMAMDHDFYDNLQWDPEDAAILRERGQMPLVYNEVAPMADWIIGTYLRSNVDWRVLPRTEDDVDLADVKTNVLKYVSDINRVQSVRNRAFADAVKAGVGWMDDGVRDDPTADILYSKYEDWRNVLWDSKSYELDLSDARYIFRWRWVDVDIAVMMFPERANQIRRAAEDAAFGRAMSREDEKDTWRSGADDATSGSGVLRSSGIGVIVDAKRNRVKLIECQYRKPVSVKMPADGPFKGLVLNEQDRVMSQAVQQSGCELVDKIMMRVHVAVFTEGDLIAHGPSPYRHNRFSLTPIWCYRRGRDRMPYGVIRRVRDIQQDLNKRASKALFLLNTNQVIADADATEDWDELRDQVNDPNGTIIKKRGSEVIIRRDTDAATGQIQMMALDAQSIQKSVGVNDDNMGRRTNAESGAAITARQVQGSVTTTEPFDNARFGTQVQGEKQLSLTEQFYTQQKVIRLTGTKGALEWVKINEPEEQVDGSVRFLNDITASQADFVVAEQDYAGTLRQVMFESLNKLAVKLPPEVAMRLFVIAMEFSDLPNKDEIAEQIRKMTGDRDPNKEPTPEEQQAMDEQTQAQQEAMQYQREQAMGVLEEQRAKVRQLNAQAAKLEAEAQGAGAEGQSGMAVEQEQAMRQLQEQAAQQIDTLSQQLAKAQQELGNRTLQINSDKDVKLELAAIDRDTKLRVAEIQKASDDAMNALLQRMDDMARAFDEKLKAQTEPTTGV